MATSINNTNYSSIFGDIFKERELRSTPVPSDINPFALAVALKEMNIRYFDAYTYNSKIIKQEHINLAKEFCEYYTKKLTWLTLKSTEPLSSFRTSLLALLRRENIDTITDNEAKILIKLPWMYEEDILYDAFKKKFKTTKTIKTQTNVVSTMEFEYLGKLTTWTARSHLDRYWFAGHDNQLYNISIQHVNDTSTFMDYVLVPGKFYKFETAIAKTNIDMLHFHRLQKFKLLEII